MMEMMQLEMFVAVVEERSVGRAAKRVHRTQPAVTLGIRKLEDGIGDAVLDRSRVRDYRPTAAGEILYEYASRILGLRNEVSAILKDGQNPAGELRIGVAGAASLERTTRLVRAFAERHPEVRVDILSHGPSSVLAELLDRKLDLAFLASFPAGAESNTDLVMSSLPLGSRGAEFWTVERRVGRSYAAKLFGEMLQSLRNGGAVAQSRMRVPRIAAGPGRVSAKIAALGPAR
jgi:DNA-binding transcriptional LysR family regulator